MLIMHLFSTIQTKVYSNHDRKCDIESICCTKVRVGWYENLSKGFRNLLETKQYISKHIIVFSLMNSFPIVLSGEAKRKSVPSGEDNNKRIEYSLVNF
jgi:hypothetical protein